MRNRSSIQTSKNIKADSTAYLTSGNLNKIFVQYLIPAVTATLLIAVTYIIDTICVGQKFGESGLAALNVVVPVTGFLYALGYMFAYGGSIQYAADLGRNEPDKAKQAFTGSFVTLAVLCGLIMALGLIFLDPITEFLCAGGSMVQMTREYMQFVFWFAPFYCMEIYFSVFTRNDDKPRLSMIGTMCCSTLNIILDVLFIYGFNWGMAGASLATGIALVVATLVEMSAMFYKTSCMRFVRVYGYLKQVRSYVRVGAPTFLRELATALVTLIINIILLRLSGEIAVAAYGIVANLATVVLFGLAGVSNGMQPLVSINAGAGRLDRVKKLLRKALIVSAVMAMVYIAFAEFFPQILTAVFVDSKDPSFLAMSRDGIRFVSPSYLLAGLTIVLNVYCESVQANNEALLLSLLRGIVLPITCVFGCAALWGVNGVWFSFLSTEMISFVVAILIIVRVSRGLRQYRYIQPVESWKE